MDGAFESIILLGWWVTETKERREGRDDLWIYFFLYVCDKKEWEMNSLYPLLCVGEYI